MSAALTKRRFSNAQAAPRTQSRDPSPPRRRDADGTEPVARAEHPAAGKDKTRRLEPALSDSSRSAPVALHRYRVPANKDVTDSSAHRKIYTHCTELVDHVGVSRGKKEISLSTCKLHE